MDSNILCKKISDATNSEVLLSFSRGKDSIAAYYQLRKYFSKIHLFHLLRVPDVRFVEDSLLYFENKWQTKIHRIIHPAFYRQINNFLFQTPERAAIIHQLALPNHTIDDFNNLIPIDLGCPNSFVAIGNRQNDSQTRRMAIKRNGAFSDKKRTFFPIYDWTNEDIRKCLKENEVKLPIDYELFGRSWDGLHYQFTSQIKKHLPEDYNVVKHYFPLIDLEILRYENFSTNKG